MNKLGEFIITIKQIVVCVICLTSCPLLLGASEGYPSGNIENDIRYLKKVKKGEGGVSPIIQSESADRSSAYADTLFEYYEGTDDEVAILSAIIDEALAIHLFHPLAYNLSDWEDRSRQVLKRINSNVDQEFLVSIKLASILSRNGNKQAAFDISRSVVDKIVDSDFLEKNHRSIETQKMLSDLGNVFIDIAYSTDKPLFAQEIVENQRINAMFPRVNRAARQSLNDYYTKSTPPQVGSNLNEYLDEQISENIEDIPDEIYLKDEVEDSLNTPVPDPVEKQLDSYSTDEQSDDSSWFWAAAVASVSLLGIIFIVIKRHSIFSEKRAV